MSDLTRGFAALADFLESAFSHSAVADSAALAKLNEVRAGVNLASEVISAFPDGNSKTEALNALNTAATDTVKAIAAASTFGAAIAAVDPPAVGSSSGSSESASSTAGTPAEESEAHGTPAPVMGEG